jgi:tRNA A-37 threonylcarbamoyl transferase component Bud32
MTQATRCRRCGAAFPAELEAREYEEICPACLAALALEDDPDPSPHASTEATREAPAKDPPPLKRGATFRGMEVLDLLGQGGMGVVYKARQIELDRTVALKVLSPRLASDEEFARRFMREAKALASLDHPHIVRVHDFGREAGLYFLVMEFVDGVSLREVLAQKKLAPEQALRIVPQICEALEYAHSRGVIHRDIKPENILLDRAGSAKIADFGLAKIVKDETGSVSITQTHEVMGTVEYMAPEQRDGLKEVDHRADIYSLGVVLYELLTGELPVGRFDLPSRRMRIDVRVDDIVLKALEKNPELRYQRASHMGTDVSLVIAAGPEAGADCPVVDLRSGQRRGKAPGRRFAVRTIACPLTVTGWDRDEIGVDVAGDYQLETRQATPVLQSQVETRSITLSVPRGVELDIVAAEGAVDIDGTTGHLAAKLHDGSLTVLGHDGSLRVQVENGSVEAHGLKTESFEIRAKSGSVTLTDLTLARGRGHVETGSGSVEIAPTADASFRYDLQSGSGRVEGPPAGHVGAGSAVLTVRTTSGSITLLPPSSTSITPEGLKRFFRQLPPKQMEHLGVYVIVNVALFIFFCAVFDAPGIPIAVAVFWGMAIALELWKSYVRQTRSENFRVARVLPAAVKAITAFVETSPKPGEPSPAPPPPPPKPGVSALAVLALLAGILAAASSAGAAIAVLVAEELTASGHTPVSGEWRVAFVFGVMGFGLTVLALTLALTGSAHLREADGLLKGKGAARVALFFVLIGLVLLFGYVRPRVMEVQDSLQGARRAAQQFWTALVQKRYPDACALLAGDERQRLTPEALERRVKAASAKPLSVTGDLMLTARHVSPRRVVFSAHVMSGSVYSSWFNTVAVEYSEGWRVREMPPLVDK